jgi:hypothetical protein
LERKRFAPFTQEDWETRNPHEEFALIKKIEDDVLYFNQRLKDQHDKEWNEKNEDPEAELPAFVPKVKTYVISAGILYGKGEAPFIQHLK